MKKIYTILFTLCLVDMSLVSCSDWLDVRPADEIKEEYLFETGNGYRTALNGIYRKMATFDLYGSNLSWGIIDAWGQVYDLQKCADNGGGKAMKKISDFAYKNSELVPTTDAMWAAAWNIIANCNNLVQQVAEEDTIQFFNRAQEKNMILGEAIALRAYMHFDLLRMYAPSPAMSPGERTFIPYVDKYPSYLSDRQTVDYCLQHIIADLEEARKMLWEVDKSFNFQTEERFDESPSGEYRFLYYRGFRLNYYAVTAELARVYLYAGRLDDAYNAAKVLIDVVASDGYFKALTSASYIESGNVKMYDDIIFALYSTDLTDWDQEINHSMDNASSPSSERYLAMGAKIVNDFFGSEQSSDWRLKYQLGPKSSYYYYRSLKYRRQDEGTKYGKVNSEMIPMIRMSEMYYIAAEAISGKDLDLAKSYLAAVKKGRGIYSPNFNAVVDQPTMMDAIVNDARREFFGEGQTFFMYKRLKKELKGVFYDDYVIYKPDEEHLVLPLPDSESNI